MKAFVLLLLAGGLLRSPELLGSAAFCEMNEAALQVVTASESELAKPSQSEDSIQKSDFQLEANRLTAGYLSGQIRRLQADIEVIQSRVRADTYGRAWMKGADETLLEGKKTNLEEVQALLEMTEEADKNGELIRPISGPHSLRSVLASRQPTTQFVTEEE